MVWMGRSQRQFLYASGAASTLPLHSWSRTIRYGQIFPPIWLRYGWWLSLSLHSGSHALCHIQWRYVSRNRSNSNPEQWVNEMNGFKLDWCWPTVLLRCQRLAHVLTGLGVQFGLLEILLCRSAFPSPSLWRLSLQTTSLCTEYVKFLQRSDAVRLLLQMGWSVRAVLLASRDFWLPSLSPTCGWWVICWD